MAKIASGNVEIYIRQLLSEALVKDVDSENRAMDEKPLKDEHFKLTDIRLSEESKDK